MTLVVDSDDDERLDTAIGTLGDRVGPGLVFAAVSEPGGWSEAEDRLTTAFEMTKDAVAANAAVVYLVHEEDLSGTREPLAATVACSLLSFARTLAMERARHDQIANVVALAASTSTDQIAATLRFLLDSTAPTGQLLDLGSRHFGRMHP